MHAIHRSVGHKGGGETTSFARSRRRRYIRVDSRFVGYHSHLSIDALIEDFPLMHSSTRALFCLDLRQSTTSTSHPLTASRSLTILPFATRGFAGHRAPRCDNVMWRGRPCGQACIHYVHGIIGHLQGYQISMSGSNLDVFRT